MRSTPRIGSQHNRSFQVAAQHAIDFGREGVPAVLSTPGVIWFLEHTALDHLAAFLDVHEMTVGVRIELDHLAAAPVGTQVTCTSRLVQLDGPIATFQVEARDATERLARGLHKRRVVPAEKLAARIQAKAAALPRPS